MGLTRVATMSSLTTDESLNDRAQQLLRVLVESYIRDGQPVGSRTLSRDSGLSLSAATIRNVMADLEELGFVDLAAHLRRPRADRQGLPLLRRHAAAHAAARTTIAVARDPPPARRHARRAPKALVAAASQLLSSVTQLAGVVTVPRASRPRVTQIEFVALSENRVLAVLVFNDREVQNRIIQLERYYSPDELRRAANFLNEHFRGRTLTQVREEILRAAARRRAST